MEKATASYRMPERAFRQKTRLFALCEEVASITGRSPREYLRAGIQKLERCLVTLKEKDGAEIRVRNRAAYLTWLVNNVE